MSEKVTPDEELMEDLETLLDKDSRAGIKNWYHVGKELKLSKETLKQIEIGHNKVLELFQYIYSKFPNLEVEEFKTTMNNIDRIDVVDKLSDVSQGKICKIFFYSNDT